MTNVGVSMPGIAEHCVHDNFTKFGNRDAEFNKFSSDLVSAYVSDGINSTTAAPVLIEIASSRTSHAKLFGVPRFGGVLGLIESPLPDVDRQARACATTILRNECPMFVASTDGQIMARQEAV